MGLALRLWLRCSESTASHCFSDSYTSINSEVSCLWCSIAWLFIFSFTCTTVGIATFNRPGVGDLWDCLTWSYVHIWVIYSWLWGTRSTWRGYYQCTITESKTWSCKIWKSTSCLINFSLSWNFTKSLSYWTINSNWVSEESSYHEYFRELHCYLS
jgi:hypothetical protein